jgi:hypothetical protein
MTRERVPLGRASAQSGLGSALVTLGERESGTARLKEMVAAYDGALEFFFESNSDYYEKLCRSNKAAVMALIKNRKN